MNHQNERALTWLAAIRSLREPMFVFDDSGAILDTNPAFDKLSGGAREKVRRPAHVSDILRDPRPWPELLEKLRSDGVVRNVEAQLRDSDAAMSRENATLYAIGPGSDRFAAIVVPKATAASSKDDGVCDDWVRRATHDLNNALTTLFVQLEMGHGGAAPDSTERAQWDKALVSAEHARSLVRRVQQRLGTTNGGRCSSISA